MSGGTVAFLDYMYFNNKERTTVELEGRLIYMCNLAESIYAKAVAKGRAEAFAFLVIEGVFSKEEAAERAGMSMEEFEKYLSAAQA